MKFNVAKQAKKAAYIGAWLLLTCNYLPQIQATSATALAIPDDQIEETVSTCFSEREPTRNFAYFMRKIAEIVEQYKQYFIDKYGAPLINRLMIDLHALQQVKNHQQVKKILEKYENSSLFTNNKSKINSVTALRFLIWRLSIRG